MQYTAITVLTKTYINCMLNKRKNKDYIPDDKTTIKHVDEILKFLSVMTGIADMKRYCQIRKG